MAGTEPDGAAAKAEAKKDPDRPVGGRRLQLIALVTGIVASVATVVGLLLSQGGSSGSSSPSTASSTPAEQSAGEVRLCMGDHHMSTQVAMSTDAAAQTVTFSSCSWPPAPSADQDGFTRIDVTTVAGFGQGESSDANEIDRIISPCKQVQLTYTNGSQGKSNFVTFTVPVPTITTMDDPPKVWTGQADQLSFDPAPDEVDYIRNDDQGISAASCVA